MRSSQFAAAVIIFMISFVATSVWAQQATPSTPTPPPSSNQANTTQGATTGSSTLQQAAGQLKTDTSKTTEDVKALDVMKATQDVSDVKKDVQSVEDSAKDLFTNPFGK